MLRNPPDLGPRDLRVRPGDLLREMVHGFTDDLQIAFDRVLSHLHEIRIVRESSDVSLASLDGDENIRDALGGLGVHNTSASASADAEIGRLSS